MGFVTTAEATTYVVNFKEEFFLGKFLPRRSQNTKGLRLLFFPSMNMLCGAHRPIGNHHSIRSHAGSAFVARSFQVREFFVLVASS
jgi:hypothetical protein